MGEIKYPSTPRKSVVDEIFGVRIEDSYRWLENFDDPAVKEWVEKQNEFTRKRLDSIPGIDKLKKELHDLFSLESIWFQEVENGRFFVEKLISGLNQPMLMYSDGEFNLENAKVAIDPNKFSDDGTVALDFNYPSQDAKLLAYGKSSGGSENSTIYLLDIESQKHFTDEIPDCKWASVAWAPDNSGFYYTKNTGGEKLHQKVYFHKIGDDSKNDKFIFGNDIGENEIVEVCTSRNGKVLVLMVLKGWTANDLYIKRFGIDEEFIPVAKNIDSNFEPAVYKEKLYIHTNWNAPRYRVLSVDMDNPAIENAQEIIPEGEDVIKQIHIVGGKIVLSVARDTHYHFLVYNLDGEFLWEIPLPTLGTGWIIPVEQNDPNCYLEFQSFFYPMAIFKVNIETKRIEKVYQTKVPEFNPDDYELRFDFYKSKDGTKIPIYIIHRKGIERDGNNPTFLTGYGGFEISMNPHFSRSIIPWLKRGGIYAEAGIRGGGEYGVEWHKAGMLENKQNVFDDFIYAGKFLISERYTNPKKLAIYGGSNGGLLMGAALTQSPEVFGAVACTVPLLDMIRFHKFGVAHIWTSEYGDPDKEDDFEYLYKYSPYHNIDPDKKYPPTLFRTAEFDGRVHPMHAMKMAAAMQSLENQTDEFLLYVESKAGHGAGAPIYKYVEYYRDVFGFLGDKVGLLKNYGK